MKKKIFLIKFLIIFSIFLIDQFSKYYIIDIFKFQNEAIYLTSFLNLQLIWNDGIAFGLLSFENDLYYNSITFLIVLVILILLLLIRNHDQYSYFYSIIIGGALGNFFDRILYKAVPDLVDLHYNNFHWFTFNVADIFITIGILVFIIRGFWVKN